MSAFSEDTGVSIARIRAVVDSSEGSYTIQLAGNIMPARSIPASATFDEDDTVGVVVLGSSGEFAILGLIQAAT